MEEMAMVMVFAVALEMRMELLLLLIMVPSSNDNVKPFTPRVKPCVIQSFLILDSMDSERPFVWKSLYFTVVLFVSHHPVCNFGEIITFGLGTVKNWKG